jgi:tRNA(fMet)-specific endonuclease VapC
VKILDTDHCVAILRGNLDLNDHVNPDEPLATTAISVAELVHGAARSKRVEENYARLEVLLSALTVLPFDESAARKFGVLKAGLEKRGETLDDLDLQIACIALENQQALLTNNEKHFERIEGLRLENWMLTG